MKNYVNCVMSENSISVYFSEGMPITIVKSNPYFSQLRQLIQRGEYDKVNGVIDLATLVTMHKSGRFAMRNGKVCIDGVELPEVLSKRLVALADDNLDITPLLKFWDNLKGNPSTESVNDLYGFLEANHIPLTSDGCFVGYKRVKEDFKDVHSGTYDNSVGRVVSMKREEVDKDRNNTCSTGLHVAAFNYANNFYGGGVLLEVKVNPADVVAVPPDYNEQKMRVCKYEVVRVCDGFERQEQVYTDDASYEDDDDSFEDDLEEIGEDFEMVVYAGQDGRLRIPREFLKRLGATDEVYVHNDGGVITLDNVNTDVVHTLNVDSEGVVRLSPTTIKNILGRTKTKYLVTYSSCQGVGGVTVK